jgi:hypothetical protein
VGLWCDLFVYAPLGFALEAPRLLPELAAKGRNHVTTARAVGQMAVQMLERRAGPAGGLLGGVLGGLGLAGSPPRATGRPAPGGPTPSDGAEPPAAPAAATRADAPESEPAAPADGHGEEGVADEGALPIPHYGSLAASQVVPRLAGLTTEELRAVQAFERANRGRRTILNRTSQLLDGA